MYANIQYDNMHIFQVLFYFLWIFEVYTDFWKFNRKRKLKKGKKCLNSRGPLFSPRPHGAGPATA
jgi:hypothetical protein